MFHPPIRTIFAVFLLGVMLSAPERAEAYAFHGWKWPDGSQILMHLQLTRPPVTLQDGSASWDASAADALAIWNQYIDKVEFVQAGATSASGGDGANSVFFSNTIYGQTFGSSALAVTMNYSNGGNGILTETDIIFNNIKKWNSYRGPIQWAGTNTTYDFHRVALHEFGHVLGLDHPDENGQPGRVALMNSIISDLDQLADDDIAGAKALYGLSITSSLNPPSVRSGDNFTYQITANNNPSSYSASGLAPGLQLDSATGLISGRPNTSGTFQVDVVVQGALGTATGRIRIVVIPLALTSPYYPPQILIGDSFSYQITAGNNPTSYSVSGLPAGLSIDPSTGIISGTPTVSGTFNVIVKALGANSEAAGTVQIVISPPRITSSSNPPPVESGDPFSYQITATHNPSGFSVSGLPAGLQFNPTTGAISGTATSAGTFHVNLVAHTAQGDALGSLRIVILAPRITSYLYPGSVDIGSSFTYQITASNHPSLFAASGLPAGLRLDPATGKISGVAELSGQYQVHLTTGGATGEASGTLFVQVKALETPTPPTPPLAKLSINATGTVRADPARGRIYVPTFGNVVVVDATSFTILTTIPVSISSVNTELSLSPDGKKLWVTGYFSHNIASIDLDTMAVLPDLITNQYPSFIRQGADGRLYAKDYYQGGAFQIDQNSGATLAHFTPNLSGTFYSCAMQMSPDHRTLYVSDWAARAALAKYDVSSGSAPVLLQRIEAGGSNTIGLDLAVTPDGQFLVHSTVTSGSGSSITAVRSANDLADLRGNFSPVTSDSQTAFTSDSALAFRTGAHPSKINVFDFASRTLVRTIVLPEQAKIGGSVSALAVEGSNSYLFVAAKPSINQGAIYIYPVVPPQGPPTPPKSLLNVSTRLRSQNGDDVLIGGFIITGTEPKKVILRSIGPSLPVQGKLVDPVFSLHGADGSLVADNDNWNARRSDVLATGIVPNDEHEAAIVITLQPGAYTAILRGVAGTTGVALVELYDLSPDSDSRIANISTRGKVETGDNVMIGGFIIGGDQPTRVLVRAMGPSLGNHGVAGALADTTLALHDGNGAKFAENDDWGSDQEQDITASRLPPNDPREAAIIRTLLPGAYTAIVRGKNDTTGVALVEVYNLESD